VVECIARLRARQPTFLPLLDHHTTCKENHSPRQPAPNPQTFWKLSHLYLSHRPSLIIYHLELSDSQFNVDSPTLSSSLQSNDTAGDHRCCPVLQARKKVYLDIPSVPLSGPSYVSGLLLTDLPSQPPPISPYRDITKDDPHSKKVHGVGSHSSHTTDIPHTTKHTQH